MRAALTLAVSSMLVASTVAMPAFADSQTIRIQISYEPPKDPEHGQIYVAAYIYLQLDPAESRRLITGTVYAYAAEAMKGEMPSSLEEFAEVIRAEQPRSLEEFAGEHGTPAQRAYNVMCMAYGADRKVFGDFAEKGFLPSERAEFCHEEYEQVQHAFEALVGPHIDQDLAREIFGRTWLGEPLSRRPR